MLTDTPTDALASRRPTSRVSGRRGSPRCRPARMRSGQVSEVGRVGVQWNGPCSDAWTRAYHGGSRRGRPRTSSLSKRTSDRRVLQFRDIGFIELIDQCLQESRGQAEEDELATPPGCYRPKAHRSLVASSSRPTDPSHLPTPDLCQSRAVSHAQPASHRLWPIRPHGCATQIRAATHYPY